jgi:hypothetical protein
LQDEQQIEIGISARIAPGSGAEQRKALNLRIPAQTGQGLLKGGHLKPWPEPATLPVARGGKLHYRTVGGSSQQRPHALGMNRSAQRSQAIDDGGPRDLGFEPSQRAG